MHLRPAVERSSLVDCSPAACEKSPVAGDEDVVVAADVLAVTTRLVETINVLQKVTLKGSVPLSNEFP